MKFIELSKALKTNIDHVYSLIGDDIFLIRQALLNIKKYTISDLEEFNFTRLDAEKMKKDELEANIMTLPISNDYRLVVLDNPNTDIMNFINKYDFSDSATVLVLINPSKTNCGTLVDCTKLDRIDINKYVLNYLAKSKLSIHEQALDYIIDSTSADMAKINAELNKLTAYCLGEGINTIDINTATNLVSDSKDYVIYMLTTAIDKKNYTEYQKILNEMIKSQSAGDIFSYLGRYFRRMQYIAIDKNDDEIASALNIKPYAIKMSRQCIAQNGVRYYINLYQKYVDLDQKIKMGKISVINALYELIF